jgi:hypothetical protein
MEHGHEWRTGVPPVQSGGKRQASTIDVKEQRSAVYFLAALTFAQRAFWARRIAARPLALMGRRFLFSPDLLPWLV